MDSALIKKFLEKYSDERIYYKQSAKTCSKICEAGLERAGIRAIVTNRAKRIDRLRDKLIRRNKNKKYLSMEDIYSDIIDLSGVRIATYFPGDQEEIDKFIRAKFKVIEVKNFPQDQGARVFEESRKYKKLFSGYRATHYRVNLKPEVCEEEGFEYCNAIVEIQVASVLMHAWAEVEHDLVYKPLSGDISVDEFQILDELNGLVLSGEIALERLQKAVKERVAKQSNSFSNHYELAAYLYNKICDKENISSELITMGRTDVLYRFLKISRLDRPESIRGYIKKVVIKKDGQDIVEQIIDGILEDRHDLYRTYLSEKKSFASKEGFYEEIDEPVDYATSKQVMFFISRWIVLDGTVKEYFRKKHPEMPEDIIAKPKLILDIIKDEDTVYEISAIQQFRNEIVHGSIFPTESNFLEAGRAIEKFLNKFKSKLDDYQREGLEKKMSDIKSREDELKKHD